MLRTWLNILGLCVLTMGVGCALATSKVPTRQDPSTARIFVDVEQRTILAPGVKDDTSGKLREFLLSSQHGVPVNNRETADLVISVIILDVNFTHATEWEWSVVDSSGALILAKKDTSAFGASGESIASQVVEALSGIDTMAFSGGQTPARASVVQAKPVETTFPTSQTAGQNSWAVVIGVENYRESLPAASGAERDAKVFAEFAQKTLNVPEANIKLLLGDRATKSDITAALMEWLPRNAIKSGGKVYVYFSGHGAPDVENGSSFLVPYDANPTYIRSGGLAVADLQSSLGSLKDQDVYVFLDSCFSGTGDRSVLPEGTRPLVPVKELKKTSVATFTASGARETTGAHPSSGHGLFTHFLLEGLKGAADADQDSSVTFAELEGFVVESVKLEARRQNREQTPSLILPVGTSKSERLVDGLR